MLISAVALFVIAAMFGLVLLTSILSNQPTSKIAALMHGLVAATALVIVILYALMNHADSLLLTSIAIFVIAALGGLTLFSMDLMKKPLPKLLAVLHPLLAVTGLIVLVIYIFK